MLRSSSISVPCVKITLSFSVNDVKALTRIIDTNTAQTGEPANFPPDERIKLNSNEQ